MRKSSNRERLKNVITSMGRVVNPWGTYPPTLGPKRAEISCYFLFLFHFNFEIFIVFFVFCFYFWYDVHSFLKFVSGQLRKQTVRSRNITQQRTNLRSTQWRDDQQPTIRPPPWCRVHRQATQERVFNTCKCGEFLSLNYMTAWIDLYR